MPENANWWEILYLKNYCNLDGAQLYKNLHEFQPAG